MSRIIIYTYLVINHIYILIVYILIIMVKYTNKKGAVEMSLNLIIMLVIGLTVLGLVISMVTGLIGKASNNFNDKLDSAQAAARDNVLSQPGFFAVGPTPLTLKLGVPTNIYIKVTNKGTTNMVFDAIGGSGNIVDSSFSSNINLVGTVISGTSTCTLSMVSVPVTIKPQETQGIVVALKPGSTCIDGDQLFLNVHFTDSNSPSAFDETRTVNIKIKG